jgi:AcrR family transcriptional regulator
MKDGPARKRGVRPRAKRAGAFHHGELREALIRAATAAVERHGHDQVSLRPLAERIGVTQPAVYRHFRDKGALLAAVAERAWGELDGAMSEARASSSEPLAAMRMAGRAYVEWAHAHPNLFRLLSSRVPAEQRAEPLAPLPREHYHAGMAGVVPLDDPRLADAFRVTWAFAHGLAVLVVERVFQLVETDEARLAAAYDAIDCYVEMLRARWPGSTASAAETTGRKPPSRRSSRGPG